MHTRPARAGVASRSMRPLRLAELLAGLSLVADVGMGLDPGEAGRMLGGDELAVKRAAVRTEFARPSDVLRTYLPHLAPSARLVTRVAAAGTAAVRAREIVQGYSRANCEVAAHTAERVGLGPGVVAGLLDVYEQWNGKGGPRRLRGAEIAYSARIAQVAATAALFHGVGGR